MPFIDLNSDVGVSFGSNAITENMVRLATDGTIIARDGSVLQVQADSICVHGDTPGAVAIAGAVRAGLEDAGVTVRSFE